MSPLSRRDLGRVAALGLGAVGLGTLTGCRRVTDELAGLLGRGIPEHMLTPDEDGVSDDEHLLRRTSFGVHPADRAAIARLGRSGYLDRQLAERPSEDLALSLRTGAMDTPELSRELVFEFPPEQIEEELARHALLRAVYAEDQLREVMTHVLCDHFSVSIKKGACAFLLPVYVRESIRPFVFGRFRELLGAVTRSAAMLVYLDGKDNVVAQRPNENHARELLELHTLGIGGGYTQRDIEELARVMTGYEVRADTVSRGEVSFSSARHDPGEKHVLGLTIASGQGEGELDRVLDHLAVHPSTARFVTRSLALHFVSDEPPEALITDVAARFLETAGDLRSTLRALLEHPEFFRAKEHKVKRPFHFVASVLRTLAARSEGRGPELDALLAMGQRPFAWPTPDGAPRAGAAWLGTLLGRFRFVFEGLRQEGDGALDVPLERLTRSARSEGALVRHVLGRAPKDAEAHVLEREPDLRVRLALALSGPTFQRY